MNYTIPTFNLIYLIGGTFNKFPNCPILRYDKVSFDTEQKANEFYKYMITFFKDHYYEAITGVIADRKNTKEGIRTVAFIPTKESYESMNLNPNKDHLMEVVMYIEPVVISCDTPFDKIINEDLMNANNLKNPNPYNMPKDGLVDVNNPTNFSPEENKNIKDLFSVLDFSGKNNKEDNNDE